MADLGSIPDAVETLGRSLTEKAAELVATLGFHSDLEVRLQVAETARAEAERECAVSRIEATQARQDAETARAEADQFRAAAEPVARENQSLRRIINLVCAGLGVAVLAALIGWGLAAKYRSSATDTAAALQAAQEERGVARVDADSLATVLGTVQAERDTLEAWYAEVRNQLVQYQQATAPAAVPTIPTPSATPAAAETELDWESL